MVSCFDVAKYFITLVESDAGDSISNLKLQKLVYYAQGFHVAMYNEPLFPERIFAWAHGPVVEELYHAFKKFGANPIIISDDEMRETDWDQFTPEHHALLDEVYTVYGQFTATKLRNMTHQEPPWKNVQQGDEITLAVMKEYFRTLVIADDVQA